MSAATSWKIGDEVRLVIGEEVGVIEDFVDAWDQPGVRIRWTDGHASPEVLTHLRAPYEFTVAQIEQGIAAAIGDREFEIVVSLLKMLAVRAPQRAQVIHDLIVKGTYTVTVPIR